MSLLMLPIIGLGQKNIDTIAYKHDDVVIKILDTLYLPLDTTPTIIRYEVINNSPKLIEFGEDFDEEEFIEDRGWEQLVYEKSHFFKGDTLVLPRVTHLIQIPLRPKHQSEHSISFLLPFHSIYKTGKKYRITKAFNFEGEEQWYYIWDKLVVKEDKQ